MKPAIQLPSSLRPDSEDPWESALAYLFRGESSVTTAFQPIADLSRAVTVGYEALSRFSGPIKASPDKWFAHAERLGCSEALDSLALTSAVQARDKLPLNTFLTLNVTPDFLVSTAWSQFVEGLVDMSRIVVEVTENRAIEDYNKVREIINDIRRRGGMFAVDDAGAGYASLQHVLALRPDFVKLDRVFVDGCDLDKAKSAMIEMIGAFAGRIDAWIIAEGIERQAELDELIRLRTPLAQGYLLGKPGAMGSALPDEIVTPMLLSALRASRRDQIVWAVDDVPTVSCTERAVASLQVNDSTSAIAVTDALRRPTGLVYRHAIAGVRVVERMMIIKRTSDVADALARATVRSECERFDPLIVTDEEGKLEGIVSLDRLVRALVGKDPVSPVTAAESDHVAQ